MDTRGSTYWCDDWYKDLDSATPWACHHRAELHCVFSPHTLLFIFYFPLLLAAVLMNISWPGSSVNSPGSSLHSLGRYQPGNRWFRKDVSARKPSREERTWVGKEAMALVWAAVSCPPPRRCCHCPFSLQGTASGPWWLHGLYGSRASSHTRAGPRSDTTARVPSCPPCAISCHSRLNEPCPRLTSRGSAALLRCTGAPLSVRQRHRGRTERGARSVGSPCPHPWHHRCVAWPVLPVPAPVPPSWRCPVTVRRQAWDWGREVRDNVGLQSL